jgi:peptide methionine sulfoxide reductase msrA/msrB
MENASNIQIAVLAGGCFWGVEEILRAVPGVLKTTVGYTGGSTLNPTYRDICTKATGHAEAIEIEFDSEILKFSELLENWFFKLHDPTTKNRQGNDVGVQYRSAVFFVSEEQQRQAQLVIEKINASGLWKSLLVTEVVAATKFYPAEDEHQDYLQKNPQGYTCHYMR